MPSRIVREGINDSKAVNQLSDAAEIFYRRLMLVVDDFGRFEADPTLLRAKLFAFKLEAWPEDRIAVVLRECASIHNGDDEPLVLLYSVGKKKLLQISNFGQRTRTSKFPAPGDLPPIASNGAQGADKSPQVAARATRAHSESYSEAKAKAKANAEANADKNQTPSAGADGVENGSTPAAAGAIAIVVQQPFDEFWELYWRKDGKKAAKAAFSDKVKTPAEWARMKAALLKQTPKMMVRAEDHRPQAVTWLKGDRMLDEESPPATTTGKADNVHDRNQKRRENVSLIAKALRKRHETT